MARHSGHPLQQGPSMSKPGLHPHGAEHVGAVKGGGLYVHGVDTGDEKPSGFGRAAVGMLDRFMSTAKFPMDAASLKEVRDILSDPTSTPDDHEEALNSVQKWAENVDTNRGATDAHQAEADKFMSSLEARVRGHGAASSAKKGRGSATHKPNNWAKWDAAHPKR